MTALAPGLRRAEWAAPVLGVGFATVILHATPGPLATLTVAGALGALVVWIVWQDLATLTISDAAVVTVAALAVALRLSEASVVEEPISHALAAIVLDVGLCGGTLLVFREAYFRLKGFDGLGLGDVKLAAAGALLIGGVGFSWALFAASLAGLVAVAAARWRRPDRPQADRLAFGAVLAPVVWLVWLIEQALPRLVGA